jgi:hypothetical protein
VECAEQTKTHKPLSASSCERWWNCPGSITLAKHAPPEVPNKYAAEGTYAHMLAELELKLRLGRISKKELRLWNSASKSYEVDGFTFSLNQEMRGAIETYVEYILDLRDRYKIGNDCIQTETSFDIPGDPDLGGTADCVIFVPYRRIIAIDFKYGAGVAVDVENNKQLLTYALGAYCAVDKEDSDELSIVQLVVIQPRVPDGIKSFEMAVDQLLDFKSKLLAHAAETRAKEPILLAGEWCKFCPAQSICKANEAYRSEQTGIEFAGIPTTPDYLSLGPARLVQILMAKPVIDKWYESVKSYALGEALKRPDVFRELGFEAKETLGNRKWIEGNFSLSDTFKMRGLVPGECLEPSNWKSPSQIEKLAKKKKISIDLSDLTTREVTGTTLAKINTKLPGITMVDPFEGVELE